MTLVQVVPGFNAQPGFRELFSHGASHREGDKGSAAGQFAVAEIGDMCGRQADAEVEDADDFGSRWRA
ncbi:hypothetical protein ACF8PL_26990 [Delftia sp. WSY_4]|uniref:hypothetical protein n=1 Tax=unclassified Delftia TaxID=2613839 RepID=UPI00370B47F8